LIDLHTHILPGVDDGPRDLAGSLTMAQLAEANGIAVLVATPHVREDHPRVVPERIPEMAQEIERSFVEYGIGVRVAPGAELAITRAVDMSEAELRTITLGGNGRDLLLETPHGPLPSLFEAVASDLQSRGFRITIAHPELSRDLHSDPSPVRRLVERGALVQVTASSLAAGRLARRTRLARRLLREGMVHVIASDSHSASWRPPDLSPARSLGAPMARYLTETVPEAILSGDDVPRPPR
jgi:protein-tyrosine phosphatase